MAGIRASALVGRALGQVFGRSAEPKALTVLLERSDALQLTASRFVNGLRSYGEQVPVLWARDLLLEHPDPRWRFDPVQLYGDFLQEAGVEFPSNFLPEPNALKGVSLSSTYYLVRHAISLPNERGEVQSVVHPDTVGWDALPKFGLSEAGLAQVEVAFTAWRDRNPRIPKRDVYAFSSDLIRALLTGKGFAETWDVPPSEIRTWIRQRHGLRERNFGELEGMQGEVVYPQVWAVDKQNPFAMKVFIQGVGEVVVESAASVLFRNTREVLAIDAEVHPGSHAFLFGHGDELQILQTGFEGGSPAEHRLLDPLENAEIRKMRA